MAMWFNSIKDGMVFGTAYVLILAVPYILISMAVTKKVNIAKYIINGLFIVYMCCLFAVVFLPLPGIEELPTEYKCQLIPGYTVYDCIVKPSLNSFAQVIFNIFMTVPFGAYLRYYLKKEMNYVILLTFLLTAFIEVGQLTGLFFIFNGSYRLFDVDDLICNTLGGVIGAVLVNRLSFLPELEKYDHILAKPVQRHA